MASTVPVCQITKVGFLPSNDFGRPAAKLPRFFWPVFLRIDLTGDRRQLLLQGGLHLAGIGGGLRGAGVHIDRRGAAANEPDIQRFAGLDGLGDLRQGALGRQEDNRELRKRLGRNGCSRAASSARTGTAARKPASTLTLRIAPETNLMPPSRHIGVAASSLGFGPILVGRVLVPRKHPGCGGHNQNSRNTDNKVQAGRRRRTPPARNDLQMQGTRRDRRSRGNARRKGLKVAARAISGLAIP